MTLLIAACISAGFVGGLTLWMRLMDGPNETPGPRSPKRPTPTYEETEAALIDTLQAAEYRIPYEPLIRWPVYGGECPHDSTTEIRSFGGYEISYICSDCGQIQPGMVRTY